MTTMTATPLKVRVTLEVIVDVDGYNDEYGDTFTRSQIREMVKSDVLGAAQEHFRPFAPAVRVRESEGPLAY